MSELDSKEALHVGDRPAYGEAPRRPEAGHWNQTIGPTLWFVIPYSVACQIARQWLPFFVAVGIGAFVGGLVVLRLRPGRFRSYGFGKWVGLWILLSASASMIALALEALVAVLFRK